MLLGPHTEAMQITLPTPDQDYTLFLNIIPAEPPCYSDISPSPGSPREWEIIEALDEDGQPVDGEELGVKYADEIERLIDRAMEEV